MSFSGRKCHPWMLMTRTCHTHGMLRLIVDILKIEYGNVKYIPIPGLVVIFVVTFPDSI